MPGQGAGVRGNLLVCECFVFRVSCFVFGVWCLVISGQCLALRVHGSVPVLVQHDACLDVVGGSQGCDVNVLCFVFCVQSSGSRV